ncbi:MAG: hypothetical protein WC763_05860, partial [Candidatus Paceibacterota bacterium]
GGGGGGGGGGDQRHRQQQQQQKRRKRIDAVVYAPFAIVDDRTLQRSVDMLLDRNIIISITAGRRQRQHTVALERVGGLTGLAYLRSVALRENRLIEPAHAHRRYINRKGKGSDTNGRHRAIAATTLAAVLVTAVLKNPTNIAGRFADQIDILSSFIRANPGSVVPEVVRAAAAAASSSAPPLDLVAASFIGPLTMEATIAATEQATAQAAAAAIDPGVMARLTDYAKHALGSVARYARDAYGAVVNNERVVDVVGALKNNPGATTAIAGAVIGTVALAAYGLKRYSDRRARRLAESYMAASELIYRKTVSNLATFIMEARSMASIKHLALLLKLSASMDYAHQTTLDAISAFESEPRAKNEALVQQSIDGEARASERLTRRELMSVVQGDKEAPTTTTTSELASILRDVGKSTAVAVTALVSAPSSPSSPSPRPLQMSPPPPPPPSPHDRIGEWHRLPRERPRTRVHMHVGSSNSGDNNNDNAVLLSPPRSAQRLQDDEQPPGEDGLYCNESYIITCMYIKIERQTRNARRFFLIFVRGGRGGKGKGRKGREGVSLLGILANEQQFANNAAHYPHAMPVGDDEGHNVRSE